jgi:hypothetical protein
MPWDRGNNGCGSGFGGEAFSPGGAGWRAEWGAEGPLDEGLIDEESIDEEPLDVGMSLG